MANLGLEIVFWLILLTYLGAGLNLTKKGYKNSIKRGINHDIEWNFQHSSQNAISLGADLISYLPSKDYCSEECKEHPSKKECIEL